jgi:hypothetical protein
MDSEFEPVDDEDELIETESAYFDPDECTCEHDRDDHGYGGCEMDDCDCEGHWEE